MSTFTIEGFAQSCKEATASADDRHQAGSRYLKEVMAEHSPEELIEVLEAAIPPGASIGEMIAHLSPELTMLRERSRPPAPRSAVPAPKSFIEAPWGACPYSSRRNRTEHVLLSNFIVASSCMPGPSTSAGPRPSGSTKRVSSIPVGTHTADTTHGSKKPGLE